MIWWVASALSLIAAAAMAGETAGTILSEPKPPPSLQDTGLYADFAGLVVDARHLAFTPQYPLWTDGASKRRWISLPPDTAIDAIDPDNWSFPIGTRFWKEFSFGGRRVETRFLERLPSGGWLYAAYAWSGDGQRADLVSDRGKRGAYPLPGGRSHTIPGVADCKVCHEAGRTVVLGFSALQLSPDRDPGALHVDAPEPDAIDLAFLIEAGLLRGFPPHGASASPRIAEASATARAALGYLHGNCGHCHDRRGKLQNIGLHLRHEAGATVPPRLDSVVGQPVRKRAPGQSAVLRIEPGHPERSAVAERIASRYLPLQMPPLGTELVDEAAVALINRWISELRPETTREVQE
jgi:hypothetical protein